MSHAWEAIGPLYEREHDSLVRYASTLVGSDAEDIVHDAFIRLASSGKPAEGSYIQTTVHGLCLNHLRDNPPTEILKPEFIEGVSRTADDQFFTTDLNDALHSLPPKQAQAFILCEIRGVTQEEAARTIGTSQATICRRVETARHSLASWVSA